MSRDLSKAIRFEITEQEIKNICFDILKDYQKAGKKINKQAESNEGEEFSTIYEKYRMITKILPVLEIVQSACDDVYFSTVHKQTNPNRADFGEMIKGFESPNDYAEFGSGAFTCQILQNRKVYFQIKTALIEMDIDYFLFKKQYKKLEYWENRGDNSLSQ